MVNITLPKGRLGKKVYGMLEAAGFDCPGMRENSRKLIFENEKTGVRYFRVKPSDVAIYVERGAADLGISGRRAGVSPDFAGGSGKYPQLPSSAGAQQLYSHAETRRHSGAKNHAH